MPGKYPDRIKAPPLYDGRFDAHKLEAKDSDVLFASSEKAVDTVIIIRVEELTPRLNISFSIPFLWNGTNEADFRVKTISVKTGNVLTDMRIERETHGPFNIRPAEWSGEELYAALRSVIKQTVN